MTTLTSRQAIISKMISSGWNNVEICTHLGITERTLRNYLSRLYKKTGAKSRHELTAWVAQRVGAA